jgi:pyruvate/2-oxoglutarate dehydrogenase complex dihydrolipoamide dehydrogenase (E3) component
VTLFEAAPRILMSEDDDVAVAVGAALRTSGIQVLENAGAIERFERCPTGVRMIRSVGGAQNVIDATLVVVAIGWVADTAELNLAAAGVDLDQRGHVQVDSQLRTSTPHIFAAGDATGHVMVVHEAVREAYLAATNAVLGKATALPAEVSPLGSFTDPEYASVGLAETKARRTHDVIVATQRFESMPRPIIDGRPTGFCKLIVDGQRHTILGCHIVGERAVELAQLAAIAMASDMKVEELALVPFSFPTYANALARAAVKAAHKLDPPAEWAPDPLAGEPGIASRASETPSVRPHARVAGTGLSSAS